MNSLLLRSIKIDWNKIEPDSYIREIEAFRGVNEIEFDSAVTFFVGENGSGKSTLLEAAAIAYGFNPEGGTRNYSFSTYDDYSELHEAIRLSRGYRKSKWGYFLRAESFYNVATKEEEYAESPAKSEELHKRSHGESFLEIVHTNFTRDSLYFLDEPEAALSWQRQLSLLAEIYKYANQGSQFIIATHSPVLLGIPDAAILTFDDGPIHRCEYEETDSYQIMKMFAENRERVIRLILDNE